MENEQWNVQPVKTLANLKDYPNLMPEMLATIDELQNMHHKVQFTVCIFTALLQGALYN